MRLKFRKSNNELEYGGRSGENELLTRCGGCGSSIAESLLWQQLYTCRCGYHFKINPRQRLDMVADKDSFTELDSELSGLNLLDFPGYDEKLRQSKISSGEGEAVVCGLGKIGGLEAAVFVMNPFFMLGSMGVVVGEKISRLFEVASAENLPIVGFTVSGGARMQEGLLSLMQMAKVSGAVKNHGDRGLLYITVLTNPTTGGVTASFAMEGDIILAEPGATVGFAGARVIEQTIRKKLPERFQTAEFVLEHGFVDKIVHRQKQKETLTMLLRYHSKGGCL